jgi:hypothetical protein
VFRDSVGGIRGGTIKYSMADVFKLFQDFEPQIVVFENFTLHPGAAKALTHSELYPVQVIGVIKVAALMCDVKCVCKLMPSVKKYSGTLDDRWTRCLPVTTITEHTKDAYLLLKYFEAFYETNGYKLESIRTPSTF